MELEINAHKDFDASSRFDVSIMTELFDSHLYIERETHTDTQTHRQSERARKREKTFIKDRERETDLRPHAVVA